MDKLNEIKERFAGKDMECTSGGDYHLDVAFLLKVVTILAAELSDEELSAKISEVQ